MDKIDTLKRTDLFYNLSPEQLQLIAAIAEERTFLQNDIIFEEEDHSRDIYVIVRGSVEVSHRNYNRNLESNPDEFDPDQETVVLATLGHGQSFGEISFIDGAAREATVRSLSNDTVLLAIDPQALMAQCEANPALGFFIIRNIAKDLAFIIRELDLHMLGQLYWNTPVLEIDT